MKTYDEIQRELGSNPGSTNYVLNEANICNVNPTHCKGGLNPLYDAAQKTFERKDVGKAPSYANAIETLARKIAEKHIRQAKMRCEHLREEFVLEIKSAVGFFLGSRVVRFPLLAKDLLARFACDALPVSTIRAMHRTARKACDARMRRMSGKSKLVEPSFFNLFTDESGERSAELDTVFVNARIDFLMGLVRQRCAIDGNASRAGKAHIALLEQARSYFLASIAGSAVKLPSSGLVPFVVPVGLNSLETIAKGKTLAKESQTVTEGKGERLASNALYKRVLRLASFTGQTEIKLALSVKVKTRG